MRAFGRHKITLRGGRVAVSPASAPAETGGGSTMPVSEKIVPTSHADIAVSETSGSGLPVLLIHGNSSAKEIFRAQMNSPLGETYRMIAMDLPGHGKSSDARDPARTYSMPGYAGAALETLQALGVEKAAIYGWSLGGHVALEMIPLWPGTVGVMISGTPPVRREMEAIQAGFQPSPAIFLAGKEDFTAEDTAAFEGLTMGSLAEPGFHQALVRTDGRARRMMFESLFAGRASDQRDIAEKSKTPIAVVNGSDDPLVNNAYIGSLAYGNLWDEHCFVLRGLAHVPFLQAPETFNPIFGRFLADMAKRASGTMGKHSATVAA